jgi:hypothetical protein
MIKDCFPIMTMDDMTDKLHDAKCFMKLDLQAQCHQIRVHLEDVHNTTFWTYNGHYKYLVMAFELCNASSTF